MFLIYLNNLLFPTPQTTQNPPQQINKIKKDIAALLEKYKDRYKTKANQTIYQLMVIGLQAELQNILYTLTYAKHEEAVDNAQGLIRKYLAISTSGNASIAPTISKFLAELEPLFIEAVEVEYQYYIKREQEKEEQPFKTRSLL